ncbi:MAG TPA: hypothetical protein VGN13_12380 [Solirubrobacteraceae bacterium]|jgi:hypothetical protein
MRRLAFLLVVFASLVFASGAGASPVKVYVLHRPRHEKCRVHYVREVRHVRRHHHRIREVVCVYVAPKPATIAPAPKATPVATAVPATIRLHTHLDPGFVQDPGNPLRVTYSFSASASQTMLATPRVAEAAPLPEGILDLYSDGVLACSINVGPSASEGECPVTYSSYGTHTTVVEYLSGSNSATTGNEPELIEPFPAVIQRAWGSGETFPSATVRVGTTGEVEVTDASFEGAGSIGVEDSFGDSCEAPVTSTRAVCTMPVSGPPNHLTIRYPGGTTVAATRSCGPECTQQVTEEWPPAVVHLEAQVIIVG